MKRVAIILLALALGCGGGMCSRNAVAASPDSQAEGRQLFKARCSECHTIGQGRKVGPDLYGITEIRPKDYLVSFIGNPTHMFEMRDPIAIMVLGQYKTIRMPNLHLSEDQVLEIIAYIHAQSLKPRPAPKQLFGNPQTGRGLFDGTVRFSKGGPPCISCHNISRLPFPMGGTMGPDLTGINPEFAAMEAPDVFPTMMPLYSEAPLTPKEQEDLEAFVGIAGVEQSVDVSAALVILAEVLFGLAILAVWFIWRNRIAMVRDSLVDRTRFGGTRP